MNGAGKMRKTLLWGVGTDFSRYLNLIHYYEIKRDIEIIGVTANEMMYDTVYGYKFLKKDMLLQLEFTIIIVMSDQAFREIEREIEGMEIGVPVIPCSVLSIPDFDFDKYIRIKEEIPTIFACNCWGGLLYHRLRLPFESTFINLFVKDEHFLRFLYRPDYYMEQKLELGYMDYDEYLGKKYPVGLCGDIEIHFNHYKDFDNAKEDWERRKKRIHWDRLLVMMYTEDESVAIRFSGLPYEKKVCFVPFESDLQGICTIPYKTGKNIRFFEIVNGAVSGRYQYYDILSVISGDIIRNSQICNV